MILLLSRRFFAAFSLFNITMCLPRTFKYTTSPDIWVNWTEYNPQEWKWSMIPDHNDDAIHGMCPRWREESIVEGVQWADQMEGQEVGEPFPVEHEGRGRGCIQLKWRYRYTATATWSFRGVKSQWSGIIWLGIIVADMYVPNHWSWTYAENICVRWTKCLAWLESDPIPRHLLCR